MEVITIITSSKEAITLFDKFIYSWPLLCFKDKDHNTAIFVRKNNEKEKVF